MQHPRGPEILVATNAGRVAQPQEMADNVRTRGADGQLDLHPSNSSTPRPRRVAHINRTDSRGTRQLMQGGSNKDYMILGEKNFFCAEGLGRPRINSKLLDRY